MALKQKNILLIVTDCLGANYVYDKVNPHIPTIKKLEKNGFSFKNTISSTTTTTPSFGSLLTGMYPFQNGVRSHSGYSLKKEIKTFPEILKENGYKTYAEFTGPLDEKIGLSKGFDEYNFREKNSTIHSNFGKQFLNKIKNHYKSPWCVILHIWSLHDPRIVIKECRSKKHGKTQYERALSSIDNYLDKILSLVDENTLIILTGDHGEYISYSRFDKYRRLFRFALFRFMKKKGLTKVPFAKGVKKFNLWHGYHVYDELVRVPLIFYNKALIKSGVSEQQIRQIDIFPTITDILNIKYSNKIEGQSAFPLMKGKEIPKKDAYVEAVGVVIPNKEEWLAGLRIDNKYKYIYYPFRKDSEEELFDLENDPKEKRNIASENRDLTTKFRKRINDMQTENLTGEKLTDDDQKRIEERLKALGYID